MARSVSSGVRANSASAAPHSARSPVSLRAQPITGQIVFQAAGPAAAFASRFNELKRAGGGGVIVADRGGVVGCVAWQVILGLHEAPIGRLTVLLVAEDARRQGIGRALVDAARAAMIDQGCATIEAMSDIEVRNANGFYRALGFAQKSYRFVSDAEPKS